MYENAGSFWKAFANVVATVSRLRTY